MRRPSVPALDEVLGEPRPVLDHGFIRVIDYMGNDAAVVQAARVSYGEGTKSVSDDKNLIHYLLRHKHTSPFEMCEIKLHIKLPIFIARQWIRHRTASVNEVSARYSVLPEEFYLPEPEQVQPQAKDNKQGRSGEFIADVPHTFRWGVDLEGKRAFAMYRSNLERGVARELSRIVLPLSTYTEWYWKTNLHNLLHFMKLRSDPHAQWEIRQYSLELERIVCLWVPQVYAAWSDISASGVSLSAGALEVIRRLLQNESVSQPTSGLGKREWAELMEVLYGCRENDQRNDGERGDGGVSSPPE